MKYIYNITINVHEEVHENWKEWMSSQFIPGMLRTGLFSEAKLLKVSTGKESGGYTYSTQYICPDKNSLKIFYRNHAPSFNRQLLSEFPGKIVLFGTELAVVEEFTYPE